MTTTNQTKGQKPMHYDANIRSSSLPNPMHLDACRQGGRIFRSKKKYTRKEKYKSKYEREY